MALSEVQLKCEELWDDHPKVGALFGFTECAAKLLRILSVTRSRMQSFSFNGCLW